MITRDSLTRRGFLKRAGSAAAVAATASLSRPRRARANLSPNEKIVIGVIGLGGMGSHHLNNLIPRKDIEIAAVCDVYTPRHEQAKKRVGGKCEGYQDFRRILDRPDVDAILSATPDHWHALMAILGCQAGKDVYVEKPLTTSVVEGRRIVDVARRYGRIVQVGIQQRSMHVFQKAMEIVQSGRIGQLVTVRTWIGPNGYAGPEKIENPPPGLDWDLWLGPAPSVPFSWQRFGGFRAFDDYAGGELTNWGPHLIDIARWGLQKEAPLSVQAIGASPRNLNNTDHEAVEVIYEFEGANVTWSQAPQQSNAGKGYGIMFQGTEGKLTIDRESFIVEPAGLGIAEVKQGGDFFITVEKHHDNFFDCMRTRRLPRADCEIGHRSTTVCLLGNIALDTGRRLNWDADAERFVNDEQANRHLIRPYRAPWKL